MDCMQGMKEFPDKYFDLAIVDPPYGIKRLENPKGRLENMEILQRLTIVFRLKSILMNCLGLAKIRLFGVQIILICLHVGILYVGININL